MNDRKRRKDRRRRGVEMPCIMCGKAKRGKLVGSSGKYKQLRVMADRTKEQMREK